MAVGRYLADTSAWARLRWPAVRRRLGPLIESGDVATCSLVDLEVLYSTRTAREYAEVSAERAGFELLPIEQPDWFRALEIQAVLARRGQTRAVGLPDLVLAAVAERHRVAVIHYDRDFDLVAEVTGQPVEWVVAPGTLP